MRPDGGERMLPVRHERGERRLVRDRGPDVARVLRDERQRDDGAAAAREQVDRPAADRLDDAMDVVGLDLWGDRRGRIVGRASLAVVARVVRHDRPIGEMACERREAAGARRRADQHERRLGGLVVAPDVVGERRARDLEGPGFGAGDGRGGGGRCGHRVLLGASGGAA